MRVGGSLSIAAVLGVSSVAWACTNFAGKFTVNGTGTTQSVVQAVKDSNGMVYCAGNAGATAANASHNLGTVIKLKVEPSTCGANPSSQLPAMPSGGAAVLIRNIKAFTFSSSVWNFVANSGCWATGATDTTLTAQTIGSDGKFANADVNGFISETLPTTGLSANNTNEASNICVGNSTNGDIAPLVIV